MNLVCQRGNHRLHAGGGAHTPSRRRRPRPQGGATKSVFMRLVFIGEGKKKQRCGEISSSLIERLNVSLK